MFKIKKRDFELSKLSLMDKPAKEEKVIYIPYESLANPHHADLAAISANYLNALGLVKTDHWKNQYEGLEQLRILNKFYFMFLCSKLDELDPWIKMHLDSLRSGILKMALLFVQELADAGADPSEGRADALKTYLPKLVPTLLIKLLDAKKFIVKEVETCFKNVVTISCSPEVVISLCEQCFTGVAKGTTWSDNVMTYLEMALIAKGDHELLERCKEPLFKTFLEALGTARKGMSKRVESMIGLLSKNSGPEAVANAIKTANITEPSQAKLLSILSGKGEEKKKPEGIKAFLQSKKDNKQ